MTKGLTREQFETLARYEARQSWRDVPATEQAALRIIPFCARSGGVPGPRRLRARAAIACATFGCRPGPLRIRVFDPGGRPGPRRLRPRLRRLPPFLVPFFGPPTA